MQWVRRQINTGRLTDSLLIYDGDPILTAGYYSNVRSDVFPYLPRGGTLLDVGGGDGATANAIKQNGIADKVGLADMVEPSPGHLLDFNFRGDLTAPGAIESIGSEHGPIDTIIACDFLEHLVDPWDVTRRLAGIMREGGIFVTSLPNVQHLSVSLKLLLGGNWTYRDAGILDRTHLRFFVRETVAALIRSADLELVRIVPVLTERKRYRFANALSFGRFSGLFTYRYIAIGRKP